MVRAGRACAKQRAQLDACQYLIVLVSGELRAMRRAQAPQPRVPGTRIKPLVALRW
jgi:hypothetical protein